MSYGNGELDGRQRRCERRVDVSDDDHCIRTRLQIHVFQAFHDLRNLEDVTSRSYGQVDVWLANTELLEEVSAHPLVDYVGEIGDNQKAEFLGNARALLFPIDWPEPFGLVMIESMAAGTPVIAWKNGSTQEVMDHCQSGFLVESIDEAVEAVALCAELPRATVRSCFEQRFTAPQMAQAYVDLFEAAIRSERHAASH